MLWCVSKGRPLWLISLLRTMCPSRLCLCLLCRTVMAAIHWVALVPGMNTIWPQVCRCECACVCVAAKKCMCLSLPSVSLFYLFLSLLCQEFCALTCTSSDSDSPPKMPKMQIKMIFAFLCFQSTRVDWSCYVSYLSLNVSPCCYELLNVSLSFSSTLWATDAGQSSTFKCQWRLLNTCEMENIWTTSLSPTMNTEKMMMFRQLKAGRFPNAIGENV